MTGGVPSWQVSRVLNNFFELNIPPMALEERNTKEVEAFIDGRISIQRNSLQSQGLLMEFVIYYCKSQKHKMRALHNTKVA